MNMIVGGALINITDNSNINLGTINLFRYRSYYYDTETGLYYLSSRYYNPQVGRFINGDSTVSTNQGINSTNIFMYCGNNPINRKDSLGNFWVILGGAVVVGYIWGLGAMNNYIATNELMGVENSYSGASGAFMNGATTGILFATGQLDSPIAIVLPSIIGEVSNVIFEKKSADDALVSIAKSVVFNSTFEQYTLINSITKDKSVKAAIGIFVENFISSLNTKILEWIKSLSRPGSSGGGHSIGGGRHG